MYGRTFVAEWFSGGTSSEAFARRGKMYPAASVGESAKKLSPGSILPPAIPENWRVSPFCGTKRHKEMKKRKKSVEQPVVRFRLAGSAWRC